jgi:flagellar biosynthesis protein FlhF
VALITTDGYRIGAHEQLRIYGRILGVPVHAVRDATGLRETLAELAGKHLVLIDTMGMSQRDRHVGEQTNMFETCAVERLLLLNASCRGDTMDDVVGAYGGKGLTGCVLTKIDEAVSLAPAIDVLIRHGLALAYVTNGQRVPEDLHLPNPSYLVHRAFKSAEAPSPHRYAGTEPALMMASAGYFPGEARHA